MNIRLDDQMNDRYVHYKIHEKNKMIKKETVAPKGACNLI